MSLNILRTLANQLAVVFRHDAIDFAAPVCAMVVKYSGIRPSLRNTTSPCSKAVVSVKMLPLWSYILTDICQVLAFSSHGRLHRGRAVFSGHVSLVVISRPIHN